MAKLTKDMTEEQLVDLAAESAKHLIAASGILLSKKNGTNQSTNLEAMGLAHSILHQMGDDLDQWMSKNHDEKGEK